MPSQCWLSSLNVDLPSQTVTLPSGESFGFEINATSKHNLLNGLDEIGLTLMHADKIKAFETKHQSPTLVVYLN